MVTGAAEAVARLSGPVGELVDDAALAQERERAVDRREADRVARVA